MLSILNLPCDIGNLLHLIGAESSFQSCYEVFVPCVDYDDIVEAIKATDFDLYIVVDGSPWFVPEIKDPALFPYVLQSFPEGVEIFKSNFWDRLLKQGESCEMDMDHLKAMLRSFGAKEVEEDFSMINVVDPDILEGLEKGDVLYVQLGQSCYCLPIEDITLDWDEFKSRFDIFLKTASKYFGGISPTVVAHCLDTKA